MIGHDHEAGAENNHVEFFVGVIFFKIVEVHVLDGDVLVIFEEFLAGGDVVAVIIYPENISGFKFVDNTLQRVTGSSAYVKNLLDWLRGLGCPFAYSSISRSRNG